MQSAYAIPQIVPLEALRSMIRFYTMGYTLIRCTQLWTSLISSLSNALFQRRYWIRFHNLFCWLCLYHHHFAKNLPFTRFGCWLRSRLQAAQAWNGKYAGLLYLFPH